MLRWPIRLASVVVVTVLAYGWGDFASDPAATDAVLLGILSVMLGVALAWLYRPGGLAAFEPGPDAPRRAPGEAAGPVGGEPATAPARRAKPSREARRTAPITATSTPAPAPTATPAPRPPRAAGGGSLWSSEPARGAAGDLDLNAATPAELAPLPGLGRVWAERIVRDREARGPYASVDDLARLEDFNPAKLPALRERLRT